MNFEYNFDNIVLLHNELHELRRTKRHSIDRHYLKYTDALYRADLIQYDLSEIRDEFNHQIRLDTVHISDKGLRYLVWLRRQKLKSILLPIVISAITTVVLYTLEHWLLPTVSQLFS